MDSGLVIDRRGVTLLEYQIVQGSFTDAQKFSTLSVALVAATYNNRFLLVFNTARQGWEIPGGHVEPGESPPAAARRELLEESGQTAQELRLEAFVKFGLPAEPSEISGVIYSAVLNYAAAFKPTSEISQITFWNGKEDIGYIDEIDEALLKLIRH